jgi:hypothetical protein
MLSTPGQGEDAILILENDRSMRKLPRVSPIVRLKGCNLRKADDPSGTASTHLEAGTTRLAWEHLQVTDMGTYRAIRDYLTTGHAPLY